MTMQNSTPPDADLSQGGEVERRIKAIQDSRERARQLRELERMRRFRRLVREGTPPEVARTAVFPSETPQRTAERILGAGGSEDDARIVLAGGDVTVREFNEQQRRKASQQEARQLREVFPDLPKLGGAPSSRKLEPEGSSDDDETIRGETRRFRDALERQPAATRAKARQAFVEVPSGRASGDRVLVRRDAFDSLSPQQQDAARRLGFDIVSRASDAQIRTFKANHVLVGPKSDRQWVKADDWGKLDAKTRRAIQRDGLAQYNRATAVETFGQAPALTAQGVFDLADAERRRRIAAAPARVSAILADGSLSRRERERRADAVISEAQRLSNTPGKANKQIAQELGLPTSLTTTGREVAREVAFGLIPVYGTLRGAKQLRNAWGTQSPTWRTVNVGMLALSAVGDVLLVGSAAKASIRAYQTARTGATVAVTTSLDDGGRAATAMVEAAKRGKLDGVDFSPAIKFEKTQPVVEALKRIPNATDIRVNVSPIASDVPKAVRILRSVAERAPTSARGLKHRRILQITLTGDNANEAGALSRNDAFRAALVRARAEDVVSEVRVVYTSPKAQRAAKQLADAIEGFAPTPRTGRFPGAVGLKEGIPAKVEAQISKPKVALGKKTRTVYRIELAPDEGVRGAPRELVPVGGPRGGTTTQPRTIADISDRITDAAGPGRTVFAVTPGAPFTVFVEDKELVPVTPPSRIPVGPAVEPVRVPGTQPVPKPVPRPTRTPERTRTDDPFRRSKITPREGQRTRGKAALVPSNMPSPAPEEATTPEPKTPSGTRTRTRVRSRGDITPNATKSFQVPRGSLPAGVYPDRITFVDGFTRWYVDLSDGSSQARRSRTIGRPRATFQVLTRTRARPKERSIALGVVRADVTKNGVRFVRVRGRERPMGTRAFRPRK